MKILGLEINLSKKETPNIQPDSSVYGGNQIIGIQYPIITRTFDGEKTPGELGVVINSVPDYQRLRLRAYDAEIKTDIVKIITGKFFKWVVGSGLKLQSEPNKTLLESEGISENWPEVQKITEARFQAFAKSKHSDFSKMVNLHAKALDAYKTAFLGGDGLVVCRIENNNLNVQVIDGQHIKDPVGDKVLMDGVKSRGNHVKHGIEFNSRGEHVAFFIYTLDPLKLVGKYERIQAKGDKSDRKLAWLIYGEKNRVDHVRGIPAISQILEKLNKLDRFTEASVSKAEQGANIVYSIEHDDNSTGENPMDKVMMAKAKLVSNVADPYALADGLANKITETTSNQTYNMPIGAKLKSFDTLSQGDFEKFYNPIFNSLCASVDVPPEVAMQMYNSNYSASRAAINSWGYIISIYRDKFSEDFYKPIYSLWLELEILKGKINLSGYIVALTKKDHIVIESYANCRFLGKNMPHIDPLKEIKAVREMLGTDGATPLISHEQAAEALNVGDFSENYAKYLEEDKGIVKPVIVEPITQR